MTSREMAVALAGYDRDPATPYCGSEADSDHLHGLQPEGDWPEGHWSVDLAPAPFPGFIATSATGERFFITVVPMPPAPTHKENPDFWAPEGPPT